MSLPHCGTSRPAAVSNPLMTLHCRYRTLLPAGHTAIDVLLLAAWIWHAAVVLNQPKAWSHPSGDVLAANAQGESIGWDPSSVHWEPDQRFTLILTGTLPAGIVSASLRPEAGWQTRHRLWDPVWFLVHEAVSIPFWFLMGVWLDAGRSRLGRTMLAYLVGRIALGLLAIPVAGNWWSAQVLFWLGLAAYGALWGSRRLRLAAVRA